MKIFIFMVICFSIHFVLASPGAHGPNGEHLTEQSGKDSGALGRQADGAVIIPMHNQVLLGLRTKFVRSETVTQSIRMPGVVQPHPEGQALVQPSSDGRFEAPDSGVLATGELVSAGQILGFIRYQDSAFELASQTSELLAVRNEIGQTKRDVKRLQGLGELASIQALEQLETRLKTLVEQEAVLEHGLEKPEPLLAPISGVLINHQARRGVWVEAGTTLFEIVATDLRYVEALTSDPSILSQLSTATIIEAPNTHLSYLGYAPQLAAGMITVNFEIDRNTRLPEPLLIDRTVTLFAQLNTKSEGIVLPPKAIVKNSSNLPIVWIKVSAERFLPQIVRYQAISPDEVIITHGLGVDNRVVINGTSLLNQIR
jgi:cobalt-zinc-cadmium efflux system membrane fusion protein